MIPEANDSVNVNGTAAQHDLYLENHYGWMLLTALVIGLAALVGTIGNVLIILAVCCVRALRTTGNIFVLNLALADMIVTLLIDPFNVAGAVAGRKFFLGDQTLCNFISSFCGPACLSSMWNMCAISLNRYCFICKPHIYAKIFTFKSSILCCIGIWILAHLLHMPNHLGWGKTRFSRDFYICTFDTVTYSYGIFYIVTGVLIPLVGVLYGYTAIFIRVRGVRVQMRRHRESVLPKRPSSPTVTPAPLSGSRRESHHPHDIKVQHCHQKPGFNAEDVKLAETLFAAFLTFLISWSLMVLLVLAHNPAEVPAWLYVIGIIMAHGNSAVNPILYGFANEKFREGYRSILGWKPPAVGDVQPQRRKSRTGSFGDAGDEGNKKSGESRRPTASTHSTAAKDVARTDGM